MLVRRPWILVVLLACEQPTSRAPSAYDASAGGVPPHETPSSEPRPISEAPPTPAPTAAPTLPLPPPSAPTPAPSSPNGGESIASYVDEPASSGPVDPSCTCKTNAGGFDLALPCDTESCVEGRTLRCSADGKLAWGERCGGATCTCKVSDPGSGDVEFACGLSLCLNGSLVECSADGQASRGGPCKN